MTPLDFKNLLDKYSRGECSAEEESLVLKWYERIKNDTSYPLQDEHRALVEARLWSKLKTQIASSPRSRFFNNTRRIAAVFVSLIVAGAALFLITTGGTFHFFSDTSSNNNGVLNSTIDAAGNKLMVIANEGSSIRRVDLEDGSEVILQPKSEIRFPSAFTSVKREVYLSGEAFFNVKRDTLHPFLVYSGKVVTRVLGTSFNIKAYHSEKEVTVAVRSGKVSVYKLASTDEATHNTDVSKDEEIILIPNQKAVYNFDVDQVSKQLVEKPEIILAKPTLFEMMYDGAPVIKIFEVLEENYGVDIVYEEKDLAGCTLTTSMSDEGLFERVKIICEAIGAQYEVMGTSIVVKSEGCN